MLMTKLKRQALYLSAVIGTWFLPAVAYAQSLPKEMSKVGVNPGCMTAGNCSLDDIVKTGAAFANMLVEISAALFFASFIYGGAMYLMSGGRQDWVKKGTDAMSKSAIGMLIVLSAWTIVRYVVIGLTGAPK